VSRRSAAAIVLAAMTTAACLSCATLSLSRPWSMRESDHFEVYGDVGSDRLAEFASELELIHTTVAELLDLEPRQETPVAPRTRVFVVSDRSSLLSSPVTRELPLSEGSGAVFVRNPDRDSIILDASQPRAKRSHAYHQYAHGMVLRSGGLGYPLWYQEGLAELFSTLEADSETGEVRFGLPPEERVKQLSLTAPLGLGPLLGASDTLLWPQSLIEAFEAEAWAFVHWHFIGRARMQPDSVEQLGRFLEQDASTTLDAGLQRAFGRGLTELESAFRDYIGGEPPAARPLALATARVAPTLSRARQLSDPERVHLLADLSLRSVRRQTELLESRLTRELEAALARSPKHARCAALLARLLAERGSARSNEWIEVAEREGAGDAEVAVQVGLARLAQAHSTRIVDETLRAAGIARLARGFELDPSRADAVLAWAGESVRSDSDVSDALSALEAAAQRRPDSFRVGIRLAEVLLESGAEARGRSKLLEAARIPHALDGLRPKEVRRVTRLLKLSGVEANLDDPSRYLSGKLDWQLPTRGARLRSEQGIVRVRGRAGIARHLEHDIVVAIDTSAVTTRSSGADVDGDGVIARNFAGRDSIYATERAAVSKLMRRLDPGTTRLGLVTFGARGIRQAELGPLARAIEQLDSMQSHPLGVTLERSNIVSALTESFDTLIANAEPGRQQQRSILLIYYGASTFGASDRPIIGLSEARARQIADQLARYDVRVYCFFGGGTLPEEVDALNTLAARTQGRALAIRNASDLEGAILRLRFTSLERIELTNRTHDLAASELRIGNDGSFRASIELRPGWNELELEAYLGDRPALTERRRIFYASPGDG